MKRNTIQCALVLDTVKKLSSHATANEIYDEISKEHPNISRGTVYRNLQKLCESGEIRKVEIPDGADHFDHLCHNHYHVQCVSCERVFDVDMKYMDNITDNINNSNGFEFFDHNIIFKGLCPECQKKDS